ncbi:4-coumarate--CoA ligase CCL1-like [Andrographis paniculata]|uniref:4-coumarate--CoA ligase CCL1-like n=1 Tax=Andrographis paniculata TaxID=175694 RepID=UPI0021E955D7|nr:4-coumarate--CoA ligase CCL1-like [Andrographis paniculata]
MELNHQNEYIFRSEFPDIDIPNHLSIHEYCFQNISEHGCRPAIINGTTGDVFTYAAVELAARRVAVGLHELGIRKGDVIMLLLRNTPEFAFAFLAASYIGATVTTANPLYTAAEITNQARISETKLIITAACYVQKVNRFASDLGAKIVTIDFPPSPNFTEFSELMKSDEKLLPEVEIDADDTAAMLFSSGTTGLPKAVMLSHINIVTCISQQVDGENPAVHTEPHDLSVCVLPLFHCYALVSVLLVSLRVGAAVLILPKFEVNELMELMQKYRVTLASFVPPILLAIAKIPAAAFNYDLSSVRRVSSGAAPLDDRLEASTRAKFPNAIVGQAYGTTEALVLTSCPGYAKIPKKSKPGSCGAVVRNSLMKIVDPVTGVSLPRNHAGEICAKADSIMKGYYKDAEATRRAIDDGGWLHTGDIGYIDDDGHVFIVDRLKELIKYKGFQVAPAELEALLISHPSVSEAAVVPMKDESAGEVPVAFVVRADGCNVSEHEIIRFIADQVAPYKRIHRVVFIEHIPKAPSGKILRKNLRSKI